MVSTCGMQCDKHAKVKSGYSVVNGRDAGSELHGNVRPLHKVDIGLLRERKDHSEIVRETDPDAVDEDYRQSVLRGVARSSVVYRLRSDVIFAPSLVPRGPQNDVSNIVNGRYAKVEEERPLGREKRIEGETGRRYRRSEAWREPPLGFAFDVRDNPVILGLLGHSHIFDVFVEKGPARPT